MTQAPDQKNEINGPPVVGAKLQEMRKTQKLSLDDLSKRAGVSKSMLSEVERNQANPTVAVLWRLANALGVSLTDFLADGLSGNSQPAITLVPAHATPVTKSVDGKCELRILGPIGLAGKVEWYELTMEAGGVLASDAHESGSCEHLSVLSGSLHVQAAEHDQLLRRGETARYPVDVQHAISNTGKVVAKALLVVEYLSNQ